MNVRTIAVVTVCKNPGPSLFEAVHSVRALADPRTRHIIVDGASTDGTPAYLHSIGSSLHAWISEPDVGIYDAMNKGWSAAPQDSYVIYLGADDRLVELPTAEELAGFEGRRCPVVYGTTCTGTTSFKSRIGAEIRFRNTLHHQTLLVRKDIHPAPPFDASYRIYGDWDFNIRLWKAGHRMQPCASLLADAGVGGASAIHPLKETFHIASRHSGIAAAVIATSMAAASRMRRRFRRRSPGRIAADIAFGEPK